MLKHTAYKKDELHASGIMHQRQLAESPSPLAGSKQQNLWLASTWSSESGGCMYLFASAPEAWISILVASYWTCCVYIKMKAEKFQQYFAYFRWERGAWKQSSDDHNCHTPPSPQWITSPCKYLLKILKEYNTQT